MFKRLSLSGVTLAILALTAMLTGTIAWAAGIVTTGLAADATRVFDAAAARPTAAQYRAMASLLELLLQQAAVLRWCGGLTAGLAVAQLATIAVARWRRRHPVPAA